MEGLNDNGKDKRLNWALKSTESGTNDADEMVWQVEGNARPTVRASMCERWSLERAMRRNNLKKNLTTSFYEFSNTMTCVEGTRSFITSHKPHKQCKKCTSSDKYAKYNHLISKYSCQTDFSN